MGELNRLTNIYGALKGKFLHVINEGEILLPTLARLQSDRALERLEQYLVKFESLFQKADQALQDRIAVFSVMKTQKYVDVTKDATHKQTEELMTKSSEELHDKYGRMSKEVHNLLDEMSTRREQIKTQLIAERSLLPDDMSQGGALCKQLKHSRTNRPLPQRRE